MPSRLSTPSTLIAATAISCAFAPQSFAGEPVPPISVRIIALNVKEGVGAPGDSARAAMGRVVTTIDQTPGDGATGLLPDVVTLQECRSITNIESFRDEFLPGFNVNRVVGGDFGGNFNAILSAPDFAVLNVDVIDTGGPRRIIRVHLQPEGALGVLSVYSAHFKAFGDAGSQATRTVEADNSGFLFDIEYANGADVTDDGVPDFTPELTTIAYCGDLNSNNNGDGTLDGMFTHFMTGQPTGALNLPYESIAGANVGGAPIISTFVSGGRLDYIVLDERSAMMFDADMNGVLSGDETNSIGFIYFSGDDGGAMSNGFTNATSGASDHRPVVVDILMAADPDAFFALTDINEDNTTNIEDLALWESLFAMGSAPDVNEDAQIDQADLDVIRSAIRADEIADTTTIP